MADSARIRRGKTNLAANCGLAAISTPDSALFGECPDEDAARAIARLGDELIAPALEPVSPTEANFGRVARGYVTCLRDRAIVPSLQREMYTQMPCREVASIDSDHSPMLSRPGELARRLGSLAAA